MTAAWTRLIVLAFCSAAVSSTLMTSAYKLYLVARARQAATYSILHILVEILAIPPAESSGVTSDMALPGSVHMSISARGLSGNFLVTAFAISATSGYLGFNRAMVRSRSSSAATAVCYAKS